MSVTPERHIAFFLAQLRGGGVPRQTLQLSAELARRGHRVTLLPAISGGVREKDVDPKVGLFALDAGPLPRLAARTRAVRSYKPRISAPTISKGVSPSSIATAVARRGW